MCYCNHNSDSRMLCWVNDKKFVKEYGEKTIFSPNLV